MWKYKGWTRGEIVGLGPIFGLLSIFFYVTKAMELIGCRGGTGSPVDSLCYASPRGLAYDINEPIQDNIYISLNTGRYSHFITLPFSFYFSGKEEKEKER
jgi:hypothetical protein